MKEIAEENNLEYIFGSDHLCDGKPDVVFFCKSF